MIRAYRAAGAPRRSRSATSRARTAPRMRGSSPSASPTSRTFRRLFALRNSVGGRRLRGPRLRQPDPAAAVLAAPAASAGHGAVVADAAAGARRRVRLEPDPGRPAGRQRRRRSAAREAAPRRRFERPLVQASAVAPAVRDGTFPCVVGLAAPGAAASRDSPACSRSCCACSRPAGAWSWRRRTTAAGRGSLLSGLYSRLVPDAWTTPHQRALHEARGAGRGPRGRAAPSSRRRAASSAPSWSWRFARPMPRRRLVDGAPRGGLEGRGHRPTHRAPRGGPGGAGPLQIKES